MSDEREELFSYYDAQAGCYEDFYSGEGVAVGAIAGEYRSDAQGVSRLLSDFGKGHVLDLACGTGYWLSAYGATCREVTLVDRSAAMLARCRRRVHELGLQEKARIIQGDVFGLSLTPAAYDAALLGFFLGHLTEAQVEALFAILHRALGTEAEVAVSDGAWSEAKKPHRQRIGLETRHVADGRVFAIRKRYFEAPELEALLTHGGFHVKAMYQGQAICRGNRDPYSVTSSSLLGVSGRGGPRVSGSERPSRGRRPAAE